MSLRGFILLVSGGIIAAMVGLFYLQTERILGNMFTDLSQVHYRTLSHTAESILQTKQYTLRTYRSLLENNNALSSQLIIAHEHHQPQSLRKRLKELQLSLKVDLIELFYYDKTPSLTEGWKLPSEVFSAALAGKSGYFTALISDEPMLLSFSPMRNFGETIGVAVLGYALNRSVAEEIATTTNAAIRFSLSQGQTDTTVHVTPLTLNSDYAGPIAINLEITSRYISELDAHTRSDVTILGVGSLLLVLFLLYGLLEFGFVRRFKNVLSAIYSVASDLDRGVVQEVLVTRHPIREVDDLSLSFGKFSQSLSEFKRRIEEQSKQEAFVQIAEQVAHDLKSPLSALDMMISDEALTTLPDKKKMRLTLCVERIREIIRSLSQKKNLPTPLLETKTANPILAQSLIQEIAQEKTVQYAKADVQLLVEAAPQVDFAFVRINASEMRRALSNLIDNAVQATKTPGTIRLQSRSENSQFIIEVQDTGHGIPAHLIPKLAERGVTFGKANGSGLGLWHAKQTVSAAGGTLAILSEENKGTTVRITLPICPAPQWWIPELAVGANSYIATVDDDISIHELWKQKFAPLEGSVRLVHFKSGVQFQEWLTHKNNRDALGLCLMDYEITGDVANGLEWVEKLNVATKSVLVTSHHDNSAIQTECDTLGVKLLAKEMASKIPLKLEGKL